MGAPTQPELDAIAARCGEALLERGWRVTTAESCTGGWIAQSLTSVAGSSQWFETGLVTYSNAAKINYLGVNPLTLEQFGAVSEQTAGEMAAGAASKVGADCAIAVTGIAGPGGGTEQKPVGMVCFGFAVQGRAPVTVTEIFDGDRRSVRATSVEFALTRLLAELA